LIKFKHNLNHSPFRLANIMNTIYQQRRNLELALDRFNWAVKGSDHVPASTSNGLIQRDEPETPCKGNHTENKPVQEKRSASQRQQQQNLQLELVPPRKRLKQCGTGGAGPSTSKTAANNFNRGNISQGKQGGGGGGGGGRDGSGSSKPTRDAADGNDGDNNNNNSNDEFDPAEDEINKTTDTQCAQCDDGGFLISCIGRCRRSFHVGIEPEEEAGCSVGNFNADSDEEGRERQGGRGKNLDDKSFAGIECNVINMNEDLAIALATSSSQLVCPSCLAYEQQCYCCGKLDDEGTHVRPCLVASCGHFYHPACMKETKKTLKLNHAARSLKEICPLHWCSKCKKQGDDNDGDGEGDNGDTGDPNNELVQCRRCPVSYHRGCIPPSWNGFEGQPQRAWMADFDSDGTLLPGCTVETSMLYCEKHKLDDNGVAEHTVPLFSNEMLKAWGLHYAKEFPHLESSQKLLKEKGVLGVVRESPAVALKLLGEAVAGGSGGTAGGTSRQMRHSLIGGVSTSAGNILPIPESIRALDASSMRATTEIDARLDARRLLDEAKIHMDIAEVKSGMVQPYPYRNRSKRTIDRVRVVLIY
jgi:hypothetical protein